MATSGGRIDRIVIELALRGGRAFSSQVRAARTELDSMTKGLKTQQGVLRDNSIGFIGLGTAAAAAQRAISLTGVSLGFLGTAAIGAGIQFDAAMQSNVIALKRFAGGAEGATKELDFLYNLAAKTPFEFQPLVLAERRMLAFGMSVSRSNELLTTLGDTVAAIGGGQDEIRRATIAIGQIQAKNKVFAEELLQLTEIGIPAYQIISEELGIAQSNLNRVGDLGIDANTAIDALIRGLTKRYGGAAAEFQKSLLGQISTFKDYARQFSGYVTMPLFELLNERVFPRLTHDMEILNGALRVGGFDSMVQWLDLLYAAPGSTPFMSTWLAIQQVFEDVSTIVTQAVVPAFEDLTGGMDNVLGVLKLGLGALHWMAQNTDTLRTVVKLLTIAYVGWKGAMIIWSVYSKTKFWIKVLTGSTKGLTRAQILARLAVLGLSKAFKGLWIAMRFLVVQGMALLLRSFVLLNTAILTTPIGWIILGIGALIVAGYLLITHWEQVKDAAVSAAGWIKDHWQDLLEWWLLWPLKLAQMVGPKLFSWIKPIFLDVLNWLIGKWNTFADALSFKWDTHIPGVGEIGMNVPKIGVQGTTAPHQKNSPYKTGPYAGTAGPSATGTPAPSMNTPAVGVPTVTPFSRDKESVNDMPAGAHQTWSGGRGPGPIVVPVIIDGKKVAEAVWNEGRTQQARK